MINKKIKILFSGGGTGGHLYPAIALCEEFKSQLGENMEELFIGSSYGIESRLVPKLGYNFGKIWIKGFQRDFSFRSIKINLLAPFRIVISFVQSFILINKFKPDIAIGTGGYASGPAIYVAAKLKIPIFLQEQNAFPGVTIRMLSKYSNTIYVSYRESEKYLKNIKFFGTPLRISLKEKPKGKSLDFFKLIPGKRTLFVFGGSQGSRPINNFLYENIEELLEKIDCQFIWQTGPADFDKIYSKYGKNKYLHISPFIYNMDFAYSASDMIISRAGALTLAEICLFGKPSILIPLPTAAGNHQEKNARSLENQQAGIVLLQKNLNIQNISNHINEIFNDKRRMKGMSENARALSKPNAAKEIVNDILKSINKNV